LDKPINKVQLFNAIHRILSKKHTPNAYIGDDEESSSDSSSPSSQFNKNVKILIAEDIIYNRNLLETMVQSLRYVHVDTSENGKIAFNMMEQAYEAHEPYDVLLLDLKMPVMDGYEVIESIQRRNWPLPKIIVVTASIMEEDRQKCKDIGIKYFITKPIELQQLKNVLLHVTELL
jgi:CheY-like chemotaxis protein